MELVPIIWNTLLFGSIFLLVVLLISYAASKFKRNDTRVYDEFSLVPDKPVVITRRHQNPNIQVTNSKHEKVRAKKEYPPRIFDIHKDKQAPSSRPTYEEVYNRNTISLPKVDGSHYGGSKRRNPRFTVLNENMNQQLSTHKHLNVGNSYRFTETNFF